MSGAAGIVLGVSLTGPAGNSLVGTAISAGLLPPLVNAGMLMAYSFSYAPPDMQATFYEIGEYQVIFYFTHVITIVIVSNLVFWLKDIDPRFRQGDDASFDDIPSLQKHRKRVQETGKPSELLKAEAFVQNIRSELKDLAFDTKVKILRAVPSSHLLFNIAIFYIDFYK